MKNFVDYRSVLKTLAVPFFSAVSLFSFWSYASAQGLEITVTFNVRQLHPNVPDHPLNRPRNGPISTIGVDPENDFNVLVASEAGGLFRSFDGARNFRHEDSLRSNNTLGIAYLGSGAIIVTAAWGFEAHGGGVWMQGAPWPNWTNLARVYSVFPEPPQCSASPGAYDIAIEPDTGQVYIATDCGVAIGSPDAGTWHNIQISGASNFRSITALGGGHLIVGGQDGVWYSSDAGWRRAATETLGNISNIHGLSRDPRGGGRAYAVNDSKQLYETTDFGVTWSQITADPGNSNCGGIAFAKAVTVPAQQGSQVRLYFGNACTTSVTSFDRSSEPTAAAPRWSDLISIGRPGYNDTRDLAFHPGTANPYLMSSDKGLEITTDGTHFDWVTRPWLGLDANEVTEVVGQYTAGSSPDLYFATWHNGVYGVGAAHAAGACPEGSGFGVLREVPAAAGVKISVGCWGHNVIADPLFENVLDWPESTLGSTPPVILSQGTYVQGVEGGLRYTTDTGATWRQIADIPYPLRDRPKPALLESDPTLIQAIQTGTERGQQVIGLERVSGFSSGGTPMMRRAIMRRFGTIGVLPLQIWSEVYAVDPNNAAHIIAADGFFNNVQISADGGTTWDEMPGLTDQVSHHGEYVMGRPAGDRTASLVSAISFCPDNSNRILIGTRQGGAYFSYNGGDAWIPVTGSDGIVNATSFFWLTDCSKAWVSTYGRGIWQIGMTLTSSLSLLTELLCKPCPWDAPTIKVLIGEHPDPKSIQAVMVLDGRITAINKSGRTTLLSVSEGSVLAKYGDSPNLKVVFEKDTALPAPSLSKQGVIQGVLFKNNKMSLITGASRLELYSKVPGKMGPGMVETPAGKIPSIDVISKMHGFGTPAVMLGEPLIVQVNDMESVQKEILVLQIDGKDVAKVDASQKVFEYVDKLTQWPLGRHVVALVATGPRGPRTVSVTSFLVPHDDTHELEKPPIPEIKPDTKPSSRELVVTAASLSAAPEKYRGQCPVTIKFSREITANGVGTVKYAFIRSDGALGPVEVLQFDSAGTKAVSTVWTLGGPDLTTYDGWQAIKILSPNVLESNKALFAFRCVKSNE
jgi:hypothetical protein